MLIWGDRHARRRPIYKGTARPRLSAPPRRLALAAALFGALAVAGCSSIQLDSLLAKQAPDTTGSISAAGVKHADGKIAAKVSDADLVYARAAAAEVLAHGAKVNSVPWQNPHTGVGGNITPLATSYDEGGLPCRDFLASYLNGTSQAWLQGSACRSARGAWEVKSLKPIGSG